MTTTTHKTWYTESGDYRVYHRDNAGAPDVHNDTGGPWYYQPLVCGDVYSLGYPTAAAALAAAERWEEEQGWAAEREAEEQQATADELREAGL